MTKELLLLLVAHANTVSATSRPVVERVVVDHSPPELWLLESGLGLNAHRPPQTLFVPADRPFPGSKLGDAWRQAEQCRAMPSDKLCLGNNKTLPKKCSQA